VARVIVIFDRTGNTLTVWVGDPKKEHVCEEIEDEIVLMKDRQGRVIGLERLNCQLKVRDNGASAPVEVIIM
jgi:hypothetical protein